MWETLYKESITPDEMSIRHLKSVIRLLEKNDINSDEIKIYKKAIDKRLKKKKSDRYLKLEKRLGDPTELDFSFYKDYMNYIVKQPDLMQMLYENHRIPVHVLVMYQSKVLWSSFFWSNKGRMTEEYLTEIIESIQMSKEKWAMVVKILDLEEDFLNSICDFIPPTYLITQDLSFIFWKNNIYRVFVFNNDSYNEENKKKALVWERFIINYKNNITPAFIDRCKYYIPTQIWKMISEHITFSDDYLIKLQQYLDMDLIMDKNDLSLKVMKGCENQINWKNVNYHDLDDYDIVKLRDVVYWPAVFEKWHDEMFEPKSQADQEEFKKTGDIVKFKNLVDWEQKLINWGLFTRAELGIMNITGGTRKARYVRDRF